METFSITRKGTLLCETLGGNYCGRGRNSVSYEVQVKTPELDPSGFVIDNAAIHSAAKDVLRDNTVSCEVQAQHLGGRVIREIVADGRGVRYCRVRVSGAKGAFAEWEFFD